MRLWLSFVSRIVFVSAVFLFTTGFTVPEGTKANHVIVQQYCADKSFRVVVEGIGPRLNPDESCVDLTKTFFTHKSGNLRVNLFLDAPVGNSLDFVMREVLELGYSASVERVTGPRDFLVRSGRCGKQSIFVVEPVETVNQSVVFPEGAMRALNDCRFDGSVNVVVQDNFEISGIYPRSFKDSLQTFAGLISH